MGIILLNIVVLYLPSAFGYYEVSKRRYIPNNWLAFFPFGQQFILGAITDNIYAYKNKKTYYRFIFPGLLVFPLVVYLLSDVIKLQNTTTLIIITAIMLLHYYIFVLINKVILFVIYKEYSPKNAILFLILSICFFVLDYVFIFVIRKNVPVSMCFKMEDEWKFKANSHKLQLLWNEYHTNEGYQTQFESWSSFLIKNFVPI